jgi:hypothetical protein|tara:strand:- start:257 stop:1105 length:849 start_codon:yes stop_codon:yes gene_type:complete
MTTREKLEKVLEFIINEENEKASDLLHDVFVDKARGIYEEIATEDDEIEEATEEEVEEAKADDDDKEKVEEADIQDQFADEIETDSEMIDQEEVAEEDPLADEMPMDDEMGDEGEDPVEDAFMNVEDALDELKAEFAQLMGDEEPMDDEMGDEAPIDDMSDMVDAEEEDPLMMGGNDAEPVEEELDYEQVGEAATMNSVAAPSNTDTASNKKSPVAGKNDIGEGNVVKVNDGSEGNHGDNAVKIETAGNVNVPGGKAGKAHSNVPAPKNSEDASNKKSPMGS